MATMADVYSSAQLREMLDKLSEGTLGKTFRAFVTSLPQSALYVVEHAQAVYQTNAKYWSNRGAFAHNYLERVVEVTIPHMRALPDDYALALEDGWYEELWLEWSRICRHFAMGG
jgi:hypothetical protein